MTNNIQYIDTFDGAGYTKDSATGLATGTYVKFLGFYEKGDGGGFEGIVRSVKSWHPYGTDIEPTEAVVRVRPFGAKGDLAADDSSALQRAINCAARLGKPLFIEAGQYRFTETLFFHHDPEENKGFSVGPNGAGRLVVYGAGASGRYQHVAGGFARGTELRFAPDSQLENEIGLSIADGGSEAMSFGQLAVTGATPGTLVRVHKAPVRSRFYDLVIVNNWRTADGDPVALDCSSNWFSEWTNIDLTGRTDYREQAEESDPNFYGTGLRLRSGGAGSGMVMLRQLTASGFETNIEIGDHPGETGTLKELVLDQCQGRYGDRGLHIRNNATNVKVRGGWFEHNLKNEIRINDGAGDVVVEGANISGSAAERANVELGDPDSSANAFGSFRSIGNSYNYTYNKTVGSAHPSIHIWSGAGGTVLSEHDRFTGSWGFGIGVDRTSDSNAYEDDIPVELSIVRPEWSDKIETNGQHVVLTEFVDDDPFSGFEILVPRKHNPSEPHGANAAPLARLIDADLFVQIDGGGQEILDLSERRTMPSQVVVDDNNTSSTQVILPDEPIQGQDIWISKVGNFGTTTISANKPILGDGGSGTSRSVTSAATIRFVRLGNNWQMSRQI